MMLSSHLCLGLPLGLVVKGFHLNIFLAGLVSGILCTWPNQLSLWALIENWYYQIIKLHFIPVTGFRYIFQVWSKKTQMNRKQDLSYASGGKGPKEWLLPRELKPAKGTDPFFDTVWIFNIRRWTMSMLPMTYFQYISDIETVVRGTLGFPQATVRNHQAHYPWNEISRYIFDDSEL